MLADLHITTCHRKDVTCRPRPGIKPWTHEERLNISKIAVRSIRGLVYSGGVEILRDAVLDDGSTIPEACAWLDALPGAVRYPHGGSSSAINRYAAGISADLVVHFEDDHVCFNPFRMSWLAIVYDFLKAHPQVAAVHLRGGMPSEPGGHGYTGAWGPVDKLEATSDSPGALLYRMLGNAQHIMLAETYARFLPLSGNAGDCEAAMSQKLKELGMFSAELQIPVYAFHSHTWSRQFPIASTDEWSRSGEGVEYGIKDMHEHLKSGKPVTISYWTARGKYTKELEEYFYAH